jgi:hypothetical protein
MDKFPQFAELPAELRFKIWHFAVEEQRVVKLPSHKRRRGRPGWHVSGIGNPYVKNLEPLAVRRFKFDKPPAVLAVNRESRHELLDLYDKTLDITTIHSYFLRGPALKTPNLLFNPEVDILYIEQLSKIDVSSYGDPSSFKSLCHVAIFDDHPLHTSVESALQVLYPIVLLCPDLENLYLCLRDSPSSYGQALTARAERRRLDLETLLRRKLVEQPQVLKRWENVLQVKVFSDLRRVSRDNAIIGQLSLSQD